MAIKTAERTINDKEVKLILVGAIDGIKITTQLSKVVFPAIAAMSKEKGKKTEFDVFGMIEAILENADELDLETIIKKLFNGATANEFPIKPDDYFAGNYGELVDYLKFALEANFESFFEAAILKDQTTPLTKKQK